MRRTAAGRGWRGPLRAWGGRAVLGGLVSRTAVGCAGVPAAAALLLRAGRGRAAGGIGFRRPTGGSAAVARRARSGFEATAGRWELGGALALGWPPSARGPAIATTSAGGGIRGRGLVRGPPRPGGTAGSVGSWAGPGDLSRPWLAVGTGCVWRGGPCQDRGEQTLAELRQSGAPGVPNGRTARFGPWVCDDATGRGPRVELPGGGGGC